MANNSIAMDYNSINTSFLQTTEGQQRYEDMLKEIPMPSYLVTPPGFCEIARPRQGICSKREDKKNITERLEKLGELKEKIADFFWDYII